MRFWLSGFLFLLFSFYFHKATSQEKIFRGSYTLKEVLPMLENSLNIRFYYKTEFFDESESEYELDLSLPLTKILDQLFENTQLDYIIFKEKLIVVVRESNQSKNEELIVTSNSYLLQGTFVNANSGETLVAGNLYIDEVDELIVLDKQGRFALELPAGKYNMKAQGSGTFVRNFEIDLTQNTTLEVELYEKTIELEDIVITDKSLDDNLQSIVPGISTFTVESIKTIPRFLGEIDVGRIVINQPGVTTVGEGATGFNVRGGKIDQNLILLDGMPIYNSSHLLGFFSIFNSDVIRSFSLNKGIYPSSNGGRVSSLLTVDQKVSKKDNFDFSGSLGPINSKAYFDIPLIKNKSGLIVAGRFAYPTYIIQSFNNSQLLRSSADYYDVNLKYDWVFDKGGNISFSSYLSNDSFSFASDTSFSYSTKAFGIQYDKSLSENLDLDINGSYTRYRATLLDQDVGTDLTFSNGINQARIQSNLSWTLNEKHVFTSGFESNYYLFKTGLLESNLESTESNRLPNTQAFDLAFFINDEFVVTDKLSISAGLRQVSFFNVGKEQFFLFDQEEGKEVNTIIDTLNLKAGEVSLSFQRLEPRVSINYRVNASTSIKAGYARNNQFIQLFSNTNASLPTDLWRPASPNLRPLRGDLYTAGVFKNFSENSWQSSVELFYKDFTDIVDFEDGTRVLLNEDLVFETLQGNGRAYGLEFFVSREVGKTKGQFNYTWSKSEVIFDGLNRSEIINNGDFFPANFDQRHVLNFSTEFKLSRLWSFSSFFTYGTGRPITLPGSVFTFDGIIGFADIERNNARIPDFHRLDIAFTLAGSNKKNPKWESSWTFSIYNLYGRRNPFSVFFNSGDLAATPQRLSVLGTPFPSLSLNLKRSR